MAASTGPDMNTYSIPEVELGDTFNTWRDISNTQTYKLNKLKVYDTADSNSITLSVAAGGSLSAELATDINKGLTFLQPVTFSSGVTFNGAVTFNADTFTVNANNVTIDDYSIVLGDTAGVTDTTINDSGGGGLFLKRGAGSTAEWTWKAEKHHGITGIWKSNTHIGIVGTTFGIVPNGYGILPIHGTGIRIDGNSADAHGLVIQANTAQGNTTAQSLEFLRYSPSGSTLFMSVLAGTTHAVRPFVNIFDGVNKKTVKTTNAHGFVFGDVVKLDSSSNGYSKAKADSGVNAEVVGVVSEYIDANTFVLTFIGEIFGTFVDINSTPIALVKGSTYYLSPVNEGKITITQPTEPGTVHKAVLLATSTTSAIVIPFTGGVLSTPVELASASSVATTISQINRFSLGDIVRFKAYLSPGITLSYPIGGGNTLERHYNTGGIFVKAQANTAEEAEIAGMVVKLNGSTGSTPAYESFDVLIDGFFQNVSGLVAGNVYFLNHTCAGTSNGFESVTSSFFGDFPTIEGMIRKPLFMATSTNSGYLFSYRGDVQGSVVGITTSDLTKFLVTDIRDGVSGDLKIGVYNGSSTGKRAITISGTTLAYPSTTGSSLGFVGIGDNWNSWWNNTGPHIKANLDVKGFARLGTPLDATPQGQDLLVVRATNGEDLATSTSLISNIVIGTDYNQSNLVLGRYVRPSTSSDGFKSSKNGGQHRSALVMGVCGSNTFLSWKIAENNNSAYDASVTLSDVFNIKGSTAEFLGSVGVTGDLAGKTASFSNSVTVGGDVSVGKVLTGTTASFMVGNVGIGIATPTSKLHIIGAGPDTPSILLHNGSGGDNQAAGGCMGLRILAGDGSAVTGIDGTILDVRDSSGSTHHFSVRKNGIKIGDSLLATPSGTAPIFGVRAYGKIDSNALMGGSSGNISSVTKINDYVTKVTFSTAMPTANYAVVGSARLKSSDHEPMIFVSPAYGSTLTTYANTTTHFYYTVWDNSVDQVLNYNTYSEVSFVVIC